MVNPYQTPADSTEESPAPPPSKSSIYFVGGWPAVIGIGVLAVALSAASTNLVFAPLGLIAFALPFFLLNLGLLSLLRGTSISWLGRLGGALMLTPVALFVFVPVCFGGFATMAATGGVLGAMDADGNGTLVAAVGIGIVVLGFVIITSVMATLIRSWAATRQNRLTGTVPYTAKTVDLDGNPLVDNSLPPDPSVVKNTVEKDT